MIIAICSDKKKKRTKMKKALSIDMNQCPTCDHNFILMLNKA